MAVSPAALPNEVDEFELMRRRIREQQNQATAQQQQQSARQFASLGNLQSGAAQKQQQLIAQQGEQQAGQRLADVDINQAQVVRQQAEAEKGRTFQTSERLGGQDFSAQQAGLQRVFQTGEREAGQKFATGERLGGQQFATSERLGGQAFMSQQQLAQNKFIDDQRKAKYGDDVRLFNETQRPFLDHQQAFQDKEFQANMTAQFVNALPALKAQGFNPAEVAGLFDSLRVKFDMSGSPVTTLGQWYGSTDAAQPRPMAQAVAQAPWANREPGMV
jgi:hypothetical protein